MTRPIPDGAQRQRAGLACLGCRAAKAKCDGRPPTDAMQAHKVCTRCSKAGVTCDWAKSKRYRNRVDKPWSLEDGASTHLPNLSDTPMAAQLDQLMLSLIDYTSVDLPAFDSQIADHFVPASNTQPNSSRSPSDFLNTINSHGPFPHGTPYSANSGNPAETGCPTSGFSTAWEPSIGMLNSPQTLQTPSFSARTAACTWAQMDATEQEEVQRLIYLYYDHIHPFIPVLSSKADLLSNLSKVNISLLHVICALASRVGDSSRTRTNAKLYFVSPSTSTDGDETSWQASWRETAECSVATATFTESMDHRQQLESIQALILHVYLSYGLGRQQRALDMLRLAGQRALCSRLHALDKDGKNGLGAQKSDPMAGYFPLSLREMARRTWWELWAVDILMGIVSGKPRSLGMVLEEQQQAEAVKVEVPGVQVGRDQETRTSIHLRYQAISFLPVCSSPTHHMSSAVRMERFIALKKSIDNLLVSLQSTWFDAVANERENIMHALWSDLPEHHALVEFWRTERESAFMGLMVLYASTIYLHLLHMPSAVPITITSCSLQAHSQPSSVNDFVEVATPFSHSKQPIPTNLPVFAQTPGQSRMQSAPSSASFYLDNIIKASQCIFATFRLVHEHVNDVHRLKTAELGHGQDNMDLNESMSSNTFISGSVKSNYTSALSKPLHVHSPFFGCSHVVGAFGLLLGLHANAPSDTGIDMTSHLFPHLAGDIFGKSEAEKVVGWRAVAMRSDVGLAQEALRGQARWWPIAGTLGTELNRASNSH